MNNYLVTLLVGASLLAVGYSLTCCTVSDSSILSVNDACSTFSETTGVANCTYCMKTHTSNAAGWASVRTCSSASHTVGCNKDSTGLIETCYCDTDKCNGVDSVAFSIITLAVCVFTKYIV